MCNKKNNVAELVRPKRKRKDRVTSPPLTRSKCLSKKSTPPDDCGICFDPVKDRGLIQGCDHVFCYSCIRLWAERSSTCPQCKRDIKLIVKSDINGQKVLAKHKIVRRSLRDTLDREEFQQRRRVVNPEVSNRRGMTGYNPIISSQILAAQQIINENVARLSSEIGSIYDTNYIGSNPFSQTIQPPMFPLNLDLYMSHLNMNMDRSFMINQQMQNRVQELIPSTVPLSQHMMLFPQMPLNFIQQTNPLLNTMTRFSNLPSINTTLGRNMQNQPQQQGANYVQNMNFQPNLPQQWYYDS